MLTAQVDNLAMVVEAIKLGAYDYVPKPYNESELLNRIEKALTARKLRQSQGRLLQEIKAGYRREALIGDSPSMKQVRETIRRLADFEGCVLIRGDSGTGKELVARALHYESRRAASPFVAVNCAAIPDALAESILFGHRKGSFTGAFNSGPGQFEAAEDGTIFLDEIGDMPIRQQAALLRVLEYRTYTPIGEIREKECRARFIFATNRDLLSCVREGSFREDLYHRIHVSTILMPTLRSRPEDVPQLVAYYTQRLCAELGRPPLLVNQEALQLLAKYSWPGNVRELRNVLEASIMLMDKVETEMSKHDLPAEFMESSESAGEELNPRDRREKQEIVEALKRHGGNQTKAAHELGYHRNTIRTKIRYLGISTPSKSDDAEDAP